MLEAEQSYAISLFKVEWLREKQKLLQLIEKPN